MFNNKVKVLTSSMFALMVSTLSSADCTFVDRRVNEMHYGFWSLGKVLLSTKSPNPLKICNPDPKPAAEKPKDPPTPSPVISEGELQQATRYNLCSCGGCGVYEEKIFQPIFGPAFKEPAKALSCQVTCNDSGFKIRRPVAAEAQTLFNIPAGCTIDSGQEGKLQVFAVEFQKVAVSSKTYDPKLPETRFRFYGFDAKKGIVQYNVLLSTNGTTKNYPSGYESRGLTFNCER